MRILAFLIGLASVLALLLKLAEERFLLPLLERLWFHEAFTPTERAVLMEKSAENAVNADGTEYTNLLLIFDTDGGRVQCYVTGRIYRQVYEGMEGMLTHRGTSFKCFDVGGVRIGK